MYPKGLLKFYTIPHRKPALPARPASLIMFRTIDIPHLPRVYTVKISMCINRRQNEATARPTWHAGWSIMKCPHQGCTKFYTLPPEPVRTFRKQG